MRSNVREPNTALFAACPGLPVIAIPREIGRDAFMQPATADTPVLRSGYTAVAFHDTLQVIRGELSPPFG